MGEFYLLSKALNTDYSTLYVFMLLIFVCPFNDAAPHAFNLPLGDK